MLIFLNNYPDDTNSFFFLTLSKKWYDKIT